MAREPETDATESPEPTEKARRRIVFPWVWLGLLVVARLAFQASDQTVDIKNMATLAAIVLGVIGLAFWYLIRGRASFVYRLCLAVAPFVIAYGFFSFYEPKFRGDGSISGFHRRGTPKADELLDTLSVETSEEGLRDWGPGEYDYPRFLGAGPWASAVGPPLDPDWQASPPVELWRRPVGAGWSAFAVLGKYAVTQEQRGMQELVVCYEVMTGEPVWSHSDERRYLPEAGPGEMGRVGPRATPTIVGDRVYTQGPTGLVNCLDALTGKPVWQLDTAEHFGADVAVWGKSGSPLFVAARGDGPDLVIINVGAPKDPAKLADYNASLVALDANSGAVVWTSGSRQTSYSSPQRIDFFGEPVVLQTSDDLLRGVRAATGETLFEHPWPGQSANMPTCSQPIDVGDDRVLMTKGYGYGSSLLKVTRDSEAWSIDPLWSPAVKPVLQTKYSNVVVRDGYAYGLNGDRLQCVDIETGERQWRKRRRPSFGFGQVLLAGEHLLVSSEFGEVILASADPSGYEELGAIQALSPDEVCWNNPVLVGEVLLHRNSVEAVAYRLPLATDPPPALASTKEEEEESAATPEDPGA